MSWQDELRQLDEELAAGRVSAEDYRNRRDALLAQTAGGFGGQAPMNNPQQPGAQVGPWTPSGGQPQPQYGQQPYPQQGYPQGQFPPQPGQPVAQFPPAPGAGPFPPLPGQPGQPGGQPGNESERTQMVQPGPGLNSGMNNDGERTQVVSGIPSGPGPQYGDGGGWTTTDPGSGGEAPPWGGSEFPPMMRPNEPWYAQGPEGFDSGGGGNKGRIFLIVGIVVVVAAIVVSLIVFKPFSHSGNNQATGGGTTSTSVPRPTTTTTPTPAGPIADIPGTYVPNTVKSFNDAVSLNFLSAQETSIYQSQGSIGNVYFAQFHTGQAGQISVVVFVVQKPTATAASSIAGQLAQLQITYNMTARTGGPTGVSIQYTDNPQAGLPLRRAEWSSDNYVAYLEVRGPDGNADDAELTSALQAQLVKLPAQ